MSCRLQTGVLFEECPLWTGFTVEIVILTLYLAPVEIVILTLYLLAPLTP